MTVAVKSKSTNKKTKPVRKKDGFWGKVGNKLSRLGKALMFPIATLPVAAILVRIGGAIPGETAFSEFMGSFIAAGGNAVFGNLFMVFAVGLAFGLSKDSRGEAALVGLIGILAFKILLSSGANNSDLTNVFYGKLDLGGDPKQMGFHGIFTTEKEYNQILATNVLSGITIGSLVAWLYNLFKNVEMPQVLGFFSGRRTIPIVALFSIMIFSLLWAIIFPWLGYGIYKFSEALNSAQSNRWENAGIAFIFGIINRLLLPFGLHNVPNTLFWFTFGSHEKIGGGTVHGDINIFLQGVAKGNTAGTFQSGFFPVFMFGLPALVAAIWYNADKPERVKVLGLLGGSALVSFFTGITEPIEFAFLYVAPLLFLAHAFLTGLFGFIVGLFGIQIGFGFSAGFIDYALSIPKSLEIISANYSGVNAFFRNPFWLPVIGVVCAATYFWVSNFLIKKLNLATPGRKGNYIMVDKGEKFETSDAVKNTLDSNPYVKSSRRILQGVSGPDNIEQVEWCATRLRFILKDSTKVDNKLLKLGGSQGEIRVGANGFQVIIGTRVEKYGDVINAILDGTIPYQQPSQTSILGTSMPDIKNKQKIASKGVSIKVQTPLTGKILSLEKVKDEAFSSKAIGDGLAIVPTLNKVYAPFDGKINLISAEKHAYGIENQDGVGILVHVGLETVQLKGKQFKPLVKVNQKVKAGDVIAHFDLQEFKKLKVDITSPVIIPKQEQNIKITNLQSKNTVKKGDPIFTIKY